MYKLRHHRNGDPLIFHPEGTGRADSSSVQSSALSNYSASKCTTSLLSGTSMACPHISNHLDNTNQPIPTRTALLILGLVNLVCSVNFTSNQTRTIISSNPSSDLNYPSFERLWLETNVGVGAGKCDSESYVGFWQEIRDEELSIWTDETGKYKVRSPIAFIS